MSTTITSRVRNVARETKRLAGHLRYLRTTWPFLPTIARGYANVLRGRMTPRCVEWAVTYECQSNCIHCLRTSLVSEQKELDTVQAKEVLDQLAALGNLQVNFTGGEPLLRGDIDELIRHCERRRMLPTLGTNGLLLTGDRARELRRAGLRMTSLSIDGAEIESHDLFRGAEGSFESLIRAVDSCRQADIEVFLCTVANHQNINDGSLYKTIDLASEMQLPLTLNQAYPVGRWRDDEKFFMTGADRECFFELLRRDKNLRWEGSSNWFGEGCPAAREKFYIDPYGNVLPCAVIHASAGNLLNEPLETIYRRMTGHPEFSEQAPCCRMGDRQAEFYIRNRDLLRNGDGRLPDIRILRK